MTDQPQTSLISVALPGAAEEVVYDDPADSVIDHEMLRETLEYVRPALQADGGDLVLLGTTGNRVALQLVGACGGCPMSTMTLTAGIERILIDRVPGASFLPS